MDELGKKFEFYFMVFHFYFGICFVFLPVEVAFEAFGFYVVLSTVVKVEGEFDSSGFEFMVVRFF